MFHGRPRHRLTTVVPVLVLAAATLAACSSGGGGSSAAAQSARAGDGAGSAAGSSGGSKAAPGVQEQSAGKESVVTAGSSAVSPASLEASRDALARRASVALQVKDIGQAVARVRGISAGAQGLVLTENIGAGGDGVVPLGDRSRLTATTYGEITISVPAGRLDAVVGQLADVGKVIRSQSSSENVGAQIVDTDSRRKTMQASVDRVRALMERATDIRQVVDLEAELSRRQADLEALESQLASLKDSVAMSPVQVSLTTEPGVIAKPHEAGGFLAGLRDGWAAFTGSVSVLLTIVGAVLPFAVLAALVGLPVWVSLRRRRAAHDEPRPVSAG